MFDVGLTITEEELDELKKKAELYEAVNDACRDLPVGYEMSLCFEKGAAWVQLICPGEILVDIEACDMSLADQIRSATVGCS